MSDEEASPARTGSNADVSRRLERVERRQDDQAKEQSLMRETIVRVEENQKHSDQLNAVRHELLKGSLDTLTATMGQFIGRIEGIIDGTIQTTQTRNGAAIMAQYEKFVERVETHIEVSEKIHAAAAGKQEGIVFAISGGKAILLTLFAGAGPVIAVIALVTR